MGEKDKRILANILDIVSLDTYNLGKDFFNTIVEKLNDALDAKYTFIGELINDGKAVKTISLYKRGEGHIDNIIYGLNDTPCENVLDGLTCSYIKDVDELFPKDVLLIELGIKGYIGVPLYNSKKKPIGIMVCLYDSEIINSLAKESILLIFASRASSELEHIRLEDLLHAQNIKLDLEVKKRTKELEDTLARLKDSQLKMVQNEKISSLNTLTSGLAHEINNPLNYIYGAYNGLKMYFDEKGIDSENKKDIETLLSSIKIGVEKAVKIVKALVEFSTGGVINNQACDINAIINDCIIVVRNTLHKEKKLINFKHENDEQIFIGNSSRMHQAVFNIIENALHATVNDVGEINIETYDEDSYVIVKIFDNGIGMDADDIKMVFDPFYTTKEVGRGIGLGMTITYNIIQEHGGEIIYDSKLGEYTKVIIKIPKNIDKLNRHE